MDKDFKKLYSMNILNDIKNFVRKNNIKITGVKEEETDNKILNVIEDLCVKDIDDKIENKYKLKALKIVENNEVRIINILSLYYVAFYFDNMNLLNYLMENNYNFKYNCSNYEMNLFVLDKELSGRFNNDEYLKLLEDNYHLFYKFYRSLNYDASISNEEAYNKFARILKIKPDIVEIKDNNSSLSNPNNLLNKEVLANFKEETILNLNNVQKEIIDSIYSWYGCNDFYKKEKEIIHNLIENYNFSIYLGYWDEFFRDFTFDEILELTKEKSKVIKEIYFEKNFLKYNVSDELLNNAINSIKELFVLKPDYNYEFDALVYDVLSIDEILKLSEEGYHSIKDVIATQSLFWDKYNFSEDTLRHGIRREYFKDRKRSFVKKLTKRD